MYKIVHNVETGDIEKVELTEEEIALNEINDAKWLNERAEKAKAKALAEAKLATLGLTSDDLKALGL